MRAGAAEYLSKPFNVDDLKLILEKLLGRGATEGETQEIPNFIGSSAAIRRILDVVPRLAWLLWLDVVVWAVIYDTMYAMADREDDLRIGVKSTAILFGTAVLVRPFDLWVIVVAGSLPPERSRRSFQSVSSASNSPAVVTTRTEGTAS